MAPEPRKVFTVLGLGLDGHPGAGKATRIECRVQLLCELTSHERHLFDALGRRIEHCGEPQIG